MSTESSNSSSNSAQESLKDKKKELLQLLEESSKSFRQDIKKMKSLIKNQFGAMFKEVQRLRAKLGIVVPPKSDELVDLKTLLDTLDMMKNGAVQNQNSMKQKVQEFYRKGTEEKNKKKVAMTTSALRQKCNGLTKEYNISNRLCRFMQTEENTRKCRSEVTKYIHDYIQKNQLKSKIVGSGSFTVDETLSDLFEMESGKQIAFFSLPGLLNNHFNYKSSTV